MKLSISSDLSLLLPADTVTQTLVVYGGRGTGKTNFGRVLAEELSKCGRRFAVIDPMGVWYGLQYAADGKSPGIEVLVLGGKHGDIPIEPTGGAVVADLVADEDVDVIIDISRRSDGKMWSKGEKIRFVTEYVTRLYERQGERRRPLMQIIDEAARYIPQIARAGDVEIAKCMGAIEQMVEEGRNVGLGITLITQRSARMNKSVSELAECMIAFRTIGPNSVSAIIDWLGDHVPKQRWQAIEEQLRKLPVGEALIISPGWLDVERVVKTRLAETFDSSATPTGGERRVSGKAKKPDLDKYKERMSATIEKAKADDPRELRRRIGELQKQNEVMRKNPPTAAPEPALSKEQEKLLAGIRDELTALRANLPKLGDAVNTAAHLVKRFTDGAEERFAQVDKLVGAISLSTLYEGPHKPTFTMNGGSTHRPAAPKPTPRKSVTTGSGERMPGGQRRVLLALARYGECGKGKLAILSRYAINGGGFNNILSALRNYDAPRITGEGNGPYAITDAGLRALDGYDPLPEDPDALFADWMIHPELGKAHREIMRVLHESARPILSKEEIAERCSPPYEPNGGGFNNAISKLRTLGVVEGGKDEITLAEQLRGL